MGFQFPVESSVNIQQYESFRLKRSPRCKSFSASHTKQYLPITPGSASQTVAGALNTKAQSGTQS